jgi:hypothetical protein
MAANDGLVGAIRRVPAALPFPIVCAAAHCVLVPQQSIFSRA